MRKEEKQTSSVPLPRWRGCAEGAVRVARGGPSVRRGGPAGSALPTPPGEWPTEVEGLGEGPGVRKGQRGPQY